MLCSEIQNLNERPKMSHYSYDSNQVRYELYQTNGGQPYNWLFFPGGPGADSSYLKSLVDQLDLPGNVWLIDLPGNGANVPNDFAENFDQWIELFPEIVRRFDHPVLVGHSFGGMFPLMFPELENYLEGFVILNAAPTLWLEEAVNYSKQFDVPDLTQEMTEFTLHPNQETFNTALSACLPYYFPKETLERGRELLSHVPFQWQPAVWWQRKAIELNFSASWIPNQTPTLIVGGKYDCICPFSLFEKDQRFHRPNIKILFIEDAGHMGWVENPKAVKDAFSEFIPRLRRTEIKLQVPHEKVLTSLLEFYQERQWEPFHSPKNLVMDLASEAGELLDLFRWMSEEQSYHPDSKTLQEVRDEIADVFKAVLYLSHKLKIDPIEAAYQKFEKMKQKYPTDKCRGKSLKYTAYEAP